MLNTDYLTRQKIRNLSRSERLADVLSSYELSFLRSAVSAEISRAYELFGEASGHSYEYLSDILSEAHDISTEDDIKHMELGVEYD
jgi:hypothetical protein